MHTCIKIDVVCNLFDL